MYVLILSVMLVLKSVTIAFLSKRLLPQACKNTIMGRVTDKSTDEVRSYHLFLLLINQKTKLIADCQINVKIRQFCILHM